MTRLPPRAQWVHRGASPFRAVLTSRFLPLIGVALIAGVAVGAEVRLHLRRPHPPPLTWLRPGRPRSRWRGDIGSQVFSVAPPRGSRPTGVCSRQATTRAERVGGQSATATSRTGTASRARTRPTPGNHDSTPWGRATSPTSGQCRSVRPVTTYRRLVAGHRANSEIPVGPVGTAPVAAIGAASHAAAVRWFTAQPLFHHGRWANHDMREIGGAVRI